MHFLQDGHFWYFVAFVLFVLLAIWKKAPAQVAKALDARAERIRADLDEARRLKEEASASLAEIQKKRLEAEKDATAILDHARDEAARLRKRAVEELEAAIKRREDQALAKISQAEQQALIEVRNQAVDLAVAAATRVLRDSMSADENARLLDSAIAELPQRLH
jgi:F-type H+-transporting ATPase subunit b